MSACLGGRPHPKWLCHLRGGWEQTLERLGGPTQRPHTCPAPPRRAPGGVLGHTLSRTAPVGLPGPQGSEKNSFLLKTLLNKTFKEKPKHRCRAGWSPRLGGGRAGVPGDGALAQSLSEHPWAGQSPLPPRSTTLLTSVMSASSSAGRTDGGREREGLPELVRGVAWLGWGQTPPPPPPQPSAVHRRQPMPTLTLPPLLVLLSQAAALLEKPFSSSLLPQQ